MSEYEIKDYGITRQKTRQGMSIYFPPKTYQEWKEECQKRGLIPSRLAKELCEKQLKK